jgi:hypothetical protein
MPFPVKRFEKGHYEASCDLVLTKPASATVTVLPTATSRCASSSGWHSWSASGSST